VVDAGDRCEMSDLDSGVVQLVDGAALAAGLPVALEPGTPLRLRVRILGRAHSELRLSP
jgi:hypothetical protein